MNDFVLELIEISKSFFGVYALKNVCFNLRKGHVLGLIGQNGAGKSTLMNIIGGVIQPDSGSMKLEGQKYAPRNSADAIGAGIAFIHQELNLFTNLSIAENIFIDSFPKIGSFPLINRHAIKEKTKQLLDSVKLNVSPDMPVEKLSPGERQLVEIAKALSIDAKIIIFDEPTTSLTAREAECLFELIGRLKGEGRSIIYISHILEDVDRLVDDIVVLRDGEVTAAGSKREFTINKMISCMVGRDIEQIFPKRNSCVSKEIALEVKNVSQSGIVRNISFALKKGEVLGIFGLMGSGRTELARILFGLDSYEKGEIVVDGAVLKKTSPDRCIKHKIAFLTENRREEGLLMDVSIAENMSMVSLPDFTRSSFKLVEKDRMYNSVRQIADSLSIKCASYEQSPAKSLSGGNQQKVVIGKWLMSKPSVFILDEPTRGIDIGAKYEVYSIINTLASQGSAILMISSELEELIGVCDRILIMSRGEIVGEFDQSEFDKEQILRAAFRQSSTLV